MSRLTQCLMAATIAALVVMPIALASGADGPVATKSASLAKQVKSLKKRVAALEGRQDGNTTTPGNNTTARPIGPAGGDLTGTYPNPTIAPSAVTGAKVADASLSGLDIVPDTIFGSDIAPNSVFGDDLANDSVGAGEFRSVTAVIGGGIAVAANSSNSGSVTCPGGTQLIAGGYAWQNDVAGTSIIASAPDELLTNTTWVVTGRSTTANTLFPWATCLAV